MNFECNGHTWRWRDMSEESGSLQCLDPIFDDGGVDYSNWPSDEDLSDVLGRQVKFFDAGDSPDYPEGIYTLEPA